VREVKERLKLHNLRTDHVMIRSELKYLIGAKIVNLKCRVFGGKTGPMATVRVFGVVRPVATVRFRVEPYPEPTREFGPVANTSKAPAPKKQSLGVSQTPIQQQQRAVSKEVFTDEDQQEDLPIEIVEELVGKAFISVMEWHFAKLYTKIDNLQTEVSTLKITVASLVEENTKMGQVRGNAPDPELQPPAAPRTPTQDLTIRPRPVLPAARKQVGTPLAREVTT